MKKQYRVRNHRKTERIYTPVADVGGYLRALRAHGGKTAFVWKEKDGGHMLSYEEFAELTERFALGLRETLGESGESGEPVRVCLIGETSPYWIAGYLAVIAAGYTAVPMDKELDPEEISRFLAGAGVSAAIYSRAFDECFEAMAQGHPTLRTLIPMNREKRAEGKLVPYDTVLQRGQESGQAGAAFEADGDTERCCELLFTSGTTGSSKCVMLCQRNVFSVVSAACEAVPFTPEDVLVSVLPLHHTYELACTLAACDYGCKICVNDSLRHVLKSFKEYQPTGLVLVPMFVTTMYKRILSEAKRSGKEKILIGATKAAHLLGYLGIDMSEKLFRDVRDAFGGRLEKIICGGAALDPEMVQIFETFGISIYEGYGITECAPLVAVTPYYKRKPGSVGPAVSCCEIRIEGTETNERGFLSGEIQVRGENVMLGYRDNDEANEAAFTADGWFRTGDVGYLDEAGYLTITGRLKSVIVLDNGKNVFPEEIEEYLGNVDTIAESVVVGREEEDGTKLVAVILPNYAKYPEMSENDLRMEIQKEITLLNKRLPSFKQIHKLEFRKTEFEKTTTKKIKRHLVK